MVWLAYTLHAAPSCCTKVLATASDLYGSPYCLRNFRVFHTQAKSTRMGVNGLVGVHAPRSAFLLHEGLGNGFLRRQVPEQLRQRQLRRRRLHSFDVVESQLLGSSATTGAYHPVLAAQWHDHVLASHTDRNGDDPKLLAVVHVGQVEA